MHLERGILELAASIVFLCCVLSTETNAFSVSLSSGPRVMDNDTNDLDKNGGVIEFNINSNGIFVHGVVRQTITPSFAELTLTNFTALALELPFQDFPGVDFNRFILFLSSDSFELIGTPVIGTVHMDGEYTGGLELEPGTRLIAGRSSTRFRGFVNSESFNNLIGTVTVDSVGGRNPVTSPQPFGGRRSGDQTKEFDFEVTKIEANLAAEFQGVGDGIFLPDSAIASVRVVHEPSTLILLLFGQVALILFLRYKKTTHDRCHCEVTDIKSRIYGR